MEVQKTIPVTNDFSLFVGSNDNAVFHGDIEGWETINNLLNYRYYVLTNFDYQLVSNDADADVVVSSNFIAINVITNHYWTNTLTTNSNHYLVSNATLNLVGMYKPYISGSDNVGYGVFYANFRKNNYFYLFPNGNVSNAYLNSNHTLMIGDNEVNFNSNTAVSFYESGNFYLGYLNGDQTINVAGNDITFYTIIYFYETGNVKQSIINRNHTINGTTYLKQKALQFNTDGTVHSSSSDIDFNF